MNLIPENYTDFFYWVKERTEYVWSKNSIEVTYGFPIGKWIQGAKWIGMTDDEIDQVEAKYSITFNQEHRAFLRILHTLDRKEEIEHTEEVDGSARTVIEKRSFFYNWLEDDVEIKEKLEWPYETILYDVLGVNQFWLKSWGPNPDSDEEKTHIFSTWLKKAPRLIPIFSHRFVVSDNTLKDKPVLSVMGSDTIIYGWDLRLYLLNELTEHLGLLELVYDETDKCYYSEPVKELADIRMHEYSLAPTRDIPFWKELIMYWSSGWSSFGMEYPRQGDSIVQPIVKADSSGDEDSYPKIFSGF